MSAAGILRRVGRNQAKNLVNLVIGRPLTVPSLSSMTLDRDDLAVAAAWLAERDRWDERDTVERYEQLFARWNGSRHAFAFMSGREALSACLYALDLRPGDEVVLPGYTCVVVPNALAYAGITPVYADIELATYGPDVASVAARITSRTRAIIIHHLFGLVCRDYEALLELSRSRGIALIEDCAHATGATYAGTRVGVRGDLAFYSSEQSKVFTTIQGGLATTNRDDLARRLAAYRDMASPPDEVWVARQLHNVALNYYRFKHPARWWLGDLAYLRLGSQELVSTTVGEERGERPSYYGRRMAAPIAALGLNQLAKIDSYNERRRSAARHWDAWCAAAGLERPLVLPGSCPVFLRYPVLVSPDRKRNLGWALRELGVKPGVWFVSQRHPAPGHVPGCPRAEEAVARCINLPCLLERTLPSAPPA